MSGILKGLGTFLYNTKHKCPGFEVNFEVQALKIMMVESTLKI